MTRIEEQGVYIEKYMIYDLAGSSYSFPPRGRGPGALFSFDDNARREEEGRMPLVEHCHNTGKTKKPAAPAVGEQQ